MNKIVKFTGKKSCEEIFNMDDLKNIGKDYCLLGIKNEEFAIVASDSKLSPLGRFLNIINLSNKEVKTLKDVDYEDHDIQNLLPPGKLIGKIIVYIHL